MLHLMGRYIHIYPIGSKSLHHLLGKVTCISRHLVRSMSPLRSVGGGVAGNGSETSQGKASYTTGHHYFVVLADFFGWVVREGFIKESPTAKIKVAKPKEKVIKPYTREEISRMLAVCDHDYEHNAKFLGSRNRAIVLVLLDTGVRLSELLGMTLEDINTS